MPTPAQAGRRTPGAPARPGPSGPAAVGPLGVGGERRAQRPRGRPRAAPPWPARCAAAGTRRSGRPRYGCGVRNGASVSTSSSSCGHDGARVAQVLGVAEGEDAGERAVPALLRRDPGHGHVAGEAVEDRGRPAPPPRAGRAARRRGRRGRGSAAPARSASPGRRGGGTTPPGPRGPRAGCGRSRARSPPRPASSGWCEQRLDLGQRGVEAGGVEPGGLVGVQRDPAEQRQDPVRAGLLGVEQLAASTGPRAGRSRSAPPAARPPRRPAPAGPRPSGPRRRRCRGGCGRRRRAGAAAPAPAAGCGRGCGRRSRSSRRVRIGRRVTRRGYGARLRARPRTGPGRAAAGVAAARDTRTASGAAGLPRARPTRRRGRRARAYASPRSRASSVSTTESSSLVKTGVGGGTGVPGTTGTRCQVPRIDV